MMQPFSVVINIGGMELEVSGNYSPACAPVTNCLPEDSYPGHGADLEVLEVKNNNHVLDFDRGEFRDRWEDQIIDAIEYKE